MNGEKLDKDQHYGIFQRSADWRDKLYRRTIHKALDMQLEDDMHVDNSKRQYGITWKEMAVIGALGLGGFYVYNQSNQQQPAQQPAALSPADSEYEVRFFDADGNPIKIEPLPQK